ESARHVGRGGDGKPERSCSDIRRHRASGDRIEQAVLKYLHRRGKTAVAREKIKGVKREAWRRKRKPYRIEHDRHHCPWQHRHRNTVIRNSSTGGDAHHRTTDLYRAP